MHSLGLITNITKQERILGAFDFEFRRKNSSTFKDAWEPWNRRGVCERGGQLLVEINKQRRIYFGQFEWL